MRRFCFLFTLLLIIGCNQQQRMLVPAMDAIQNEPVVEAPATEEPATEEEVAIDVDFSDVELPPEGTIPEGITILDTDRIFHYTQEAWAETFYVDTFETAAEASTSDVVLEYFESVKVWMEAYCGKAEQAPPPELNIQFTSRVELQKFKDTLPGGYTHTFDDNKWWGSNTEWVNIVDSTDAYFGVSIIANDPCKNFR